MRRGRRAGTATLVVHTFRPDVGVSEAFVHVSPAKIGFVVGRAVGSAPVRNRVRRRLRHLCRPLADAAPAGSLSVVRALPAAADASSNRLDEDLQSALRRLGLPATPSPTPSTTGSVR